MTRILRWMLVLGCLLTLMLPLLADDDDEGGGATLDPGLQWRLGCSAWDRREYDDAAAIYLAFGEKNPDDENVLEGWWRAYLVFHDYRPNPKRAKETYDSAMEACERWTKKYNESKPDRAARGMWIKAMLLDHEGNRQLSITTMINLAKKYPTVNWGGEPYWHLGEWLREAKRNAEAIPYYDQYVKCVGTSTEWGAAALYRIGWCNEDLGRKEDAIAAYQRVLHSDYNWGWGQMHWNALDAARRLKKMGEDQLARQFLIKIVDKCDQNWDVTKQAMAELGEKLAKKIWIHPHLYYRYYGSTVNVDAHTKCTLKQEINLLIRPTYLSKDDPFKGTITFAPKVEIAKVPDAMKPAEGGDGKSYQALLDIQAGGDYWYNFVRADQSVELPEGVVITRKWEKAGSTWGECQIRVQSTGRWHIWIYLPNTKTNANNINIQPNEVYEGGKTLRWYDWFDLTQGMTLKFPIEVGGNVAEYYPKIRMEHWYGPGYPEKSGNGNEAVFDMREATVKVKSEGSFPFTANTPTYTEITLDEVIK